MKNISLLTELLEKMEVVELSHKLEEHMPIWPTHSRFYKTLWHSYLHGDAATDYQLLINEHHGTHIDSPAHFMKDGEAHVWIDEIPLKNFWGPCVVIDASFIGANGTLTDQHVKDWEEKNGDICKNDIVLVSFGWAKFWKKRPDSYQFTHDWPGIGASAAQYLVEKKIKMLGVDTLAADGYGIEGDPAHHILLSKKIPIIENLNNLDLIPLRGYFMAHPLPITKGSASPVRAIAFIER
ncbi:cyclase family protein [Petroclostridium sp. X23]|uniref:cyclase family protein n=1 Tax=Petroclostridium sp. X23 TaxID=3045146 RepID=UPI0024ADE259|nr:cyclase family protein [Petroclostridium sp. X23]WHH60368.1 cyclase family protein [Petroclostridium sp. X23]